MSKPHCRCRCDRSREGADRDGRADGCDVDSGWSWGPPREPLRSCQVHRDSGSRCLTGSRPGVLVRTAGRTRLSGQDLLPVPLQEMQERHPGGLGMHPAHGPPSGRSGVVRQEGTETSLRRCAPARLHRQRCDTDPAPDRMAAPVSTRCGARAMTVSPAAPTPSGQGSRGSCSRLRRFRAHFR